MSKPSRTSLAHASAFPSHRRATDSRPTGVSDRFILIGLLQREYTSRAAIEPVQAAVGHVHFDVARLRVDADEDELWTLESTLSVPTPHAAVQNKGGDTPGGGI